MVAVVAQRKLFPTVDHKPFVSMRENVCNEACIESTTTQSGKGGEESSLSRKPQTAVWTAIPSVPRSIAGAQALRRYSFATLTRKSREDGVQQEQRVDLPLRPRQVELGHLA